MHTAPSKDKFFVEQTLINYFRNRNPPEYKKTVERPSRDDRLRDVIEYKKILECKMNEADSVEKEERALLETRIQDINNVGLWNIRENSKIG